MCKKTSDLAEDGFPKYGTSSTVIHMLGVTSSRYQTIKCCWNLLTPADLSILMLAAVLIPFLDSLYDKGSVLTLVGVKISIKVANQHGGGILWITVAVAAPFCHMCHT